MKKGQLCECNSRNKPNDDNRNILKKWGSNEFILVLLKSMTSHRFTIIDDKLLKQHCIICGNVIANEAIKFSKLTWH